MALRNNQNPSVPPSRGGTQAYPPVSGQPYARDPYGGQPYAADPYAGSYQQAGQHRQANSYGQPYQDPRAAQYGQHAPYGQHAQPGGYAQPGRAVGYEPLPYARGAHSARGAHGAPEPEPPKKKGGKAGLIAAILLLVVGLALLVGAGYVWLNSQQKYQANIEEYHELAVANVTEDVATGRPVVDFAALKLQNPEIVGWVQIPGTPVNYPVVQHSDNDYYLNHSFLGRYDEFGAIFMDYRSSSSLYDWNTVLYGHHLKNGEMFAKVADYSDQAEFNTLKNIYYVSDDGQVHVLVPLCCMVVNGYDVASIQFDFADQWSFEAYVQSLIDRSSARSATATASGVEHIYMFSTCSYAQENDRTILVCVDLNGSNGPVVDASQSMNDIQAAADQAAGIYDETPVEA